MPRKTSRRALSATVELAGLGVLSWQERATGPRLGFCALSVPVEIDATFASAKRGPLGGYVATLSGRLETTLRPRIGRWLVRTRGEVTAHDAWSGTAHVGLSDEGRLSGHAVAASGALAYLGGSVECAEVQTDPARNASGITSLAA